MKALKLEDAIRKCPKKLPPRAARGHMLKGVSSQRETMPRLLGNAR